MNISKISMNDNAQMVNFQVRPRISKHAVKVAIPAMVTTLGLATTPNDVFETQDSISEEINDAMNYYQSNSPIKKAHKTANLNYGAAKFNG